MAPRSPASRYRFGLALAIAAFSGYFVLTALGDLLPIEQLGASLDTSGGVTAVRGVAPGGPADAAGLRAGDQILAIEGRPIRNALDWVSVYARVEEGQPIPVTVRRGIVVLQHELRFHRRPGGPWGSSHGVVVVLTRLVQLVTLLFAIALAVRAKGPSAILGFWLLATIAVYSVGLPPRMAVVWRQLPLPLEVLFYVPSVSKVLIGLIFFAFFRTLLGMPPLAGVKGALIAVPFAVFAVWDVMFLIALMYRPERLPQLTGVMPLVVVVNFVFIVAALIMMGVYYRTLQGATERRRLRWILAGSVMGCAAGVPTVAALWLGVGDDPTSVSDTPLGLQLAYTAFLVMPASFWWAIARGQLFDLGFVARRGLHHVFARRALLVITPVALALFIAEATLHRDESLRALVQRHGVLYLSASMALVAFQMRRASWLDGLDRRLFRERYDASQLLRDVAVEVRTTRDLKLAAVAAVTQIEAALHPEWIAIYTGGAGEDALRLLAGGAPESDWPRRTGVMETVRVAKRPMDVANDSREWAGEAWPSDQVEWLRSAGVNLIVLLFVDAAGSEALLALGAKRSGEPYSREDKNLLQAVAESLGELAHTAVAPSGPVPDAAGPESSSWDRRLWHLADAVAGGSPVDWAKESTEFGAEGQRQVLFELQALERLAQVHGAPSGERVDGVEAGNSAGATVTRWGPFEIREQIGTGRFGSVFRAWDPRLEREVAVKLLNVPGIDRAACLREARLLARVRHPNVVHVYGADEVDDVAGFWMELIDGRTIGELLQERGPLAVDQLLAVADALCRALAAVHRAGLVHQDVKVQNVMQDTDGRIVLMDLGAATGEIGRPRWGTPSYMGLELFAGGVASAQSDLYSLGVLLFVLATAEFPIEGRNYEEIAEKHAERKTRRLGELRADLPRGFLEAIDRVLSADPADRFPSAGDFAAAIRTEAR